MDQLLDDHIQNCLNKLYIDMRKRENSIDEYQGEIDEFQEKIDKIESELFNMKHKIRLIKLYTKKLREIDCDITLRELIKIICMDILNDNYQKEYDVMKNTIVNNIEKIKKCYDNI